MKRKNSATLLASNLLQKAGQALFWRSNKESFMKRLLLLAALAAPLFLAACDDEDDHSNDIVLPGDTAYPQTDIDRKRSRWGRLTGDSGLSIGGAGEEDAANTGSNNPLGVNSFLWRATLDTLSFMPLTTTDPFGGTILTDWYEDPQAPGTRFKVNALILDRNLRAGSLKINVFRQAKGSTGTWEDAPVDAAMGRKLEDTVLTRARQLRVKQLGY